MKRRQAVLGTEPWTPGTRVRCLVIGLLFAGLLTWLVAASPARADGVPLNTGDVLAAVGDGDVFHFDRAGTKLDTLDTTTNATYTTGMCFDPSGNLFVTDFSSDISEFNPSGNLVNATFVSDYPGSAESCAWDTHGHMFVGGPGTATISEYDTTGTLIHTFDVQGGTGTGGTDNIALAADGCTLFYDGEGSDILRYNVCTSTQLPDFVDGAAGGDCFALAVRPNGDVMIACSGQADRFNAAGALVQSYPDPSGADLFALNLDPDNTTFWTGDDANGQVFHIDINSGTVLGQFPSNPNSGLFGLAIVGQIAVGTQNPTSTTVSCSPNPVGVSSPTTCTATVTDTASTGKTTPTGSVTFTSDGSGAFGSGGSCTLSGSGSSASCSVTYTPSASGTQTITATYGGDSGHTGSSGTTKLNVNGGGGDTTPPTCKLTATIAGPPKQIQVTVQDTGSGLASVVVTKSTNAVTVVPPFTSGTTSAVVVTSTKINQSQNSNMALKVTDVAGNVTLCDPALIGLSHNWAKLQKVQMRHLAQAESKIEIVNGWYGVQQVRIAVNGKVVRRLVMRNGQTRKFNVARAMRAGNRNTVTMILSGKAGGAATVVIHD